MTPPGQPPAPAPLPRAGAHARAGEPAEGARALPRTHGKRLAGAEALYRTIPLAEAPPFALCRRANGLAYARWKQGFPEEGAELAREACRHAGDGGHLRLRAMALTMLSRIVGGPEGEEARRRAAAIATALDDELLRMRFEGGRPRR